MPTPDEVYSGAAEQFHDPMQEQFQREENPWAHGGPHGPVASSGSHAIAPPSADRVPPPADRPIATPWNTAPGVQFAPADIGGPGGGPRVPPPAQMPQSLGGFNLNLSATATPQAPPPELDLAESGPTKLKCPKCDTINMASAKMCKNCGHDLSDARKAKFANMSDGTMQAFLNLSADQLSGVLGDLPREQQDLVLSKLKAAARNALPESAFAIPEERKFPCHDESHARNALSRAAGTKYEARVKAFVKKKYPNIDVNASQPEHQATVFFNLANDGGQMKDGLLWKVLCKTGTLALSPGPGQVDMDKPLELTPDLFMAAKSSYDDGAYEHVVIPAKHEDAHDPLANHGTVDALDVLNKADALADVRLSQKAKDQIATDPDDTLYMLGGLHFTEPDTLAKAQHGSILNCSVGFKFNVRPNKLTGKTYPVAIEHVALTQQPWVYGLPAFGTTNLGGPFNFEDEVPYDGVFLAVEAPAEPSTEDSHTEPTGTLPEDNGDGELPTTTPNPGNGEPSTMPAEIAPTTTTTPEGENALERVLADLTARAEQAESRNQELETQLSQTNTVLGATTDQLHKEQVAKKIKALQLGGISPAVLTRVEALMLADKPSLDPDDKLELSAAVPEGEEGAPVEKQFGSITEVIDFVLSAMPVPEGFDPSTIQTEVALSQRTETDEKTAGQRVDDIERKIHPSRFDSDGKRISAADRHKPATT